MVHNVITSSAAGHKKNIAWYLKLKLFLLHSVRKVLSFWVIQKGKLEFSKNR